MDEVIEIENYIDRDCMRHLHLMSNENNFEVHLPAGVDAKVTQEAGVYHLRASWQAREAFAGTMRGNERREFPVVLWALEHGKRVSESIWDAAHEYLRVFGYKPRFAAVRSYPESMGLDVDVATECGEVALIECADVPIRFVMVY